MTMAFKPARVAFAIVMREFQLDDDAKKAKLMTYFPNKNTFATFVH